MAMTVTWALVFVIICVGLRSLKKFSTLMLAMRLTLLAALCVASSTLSGAGHGVLALLRPDFSKAYAEKTWVSASQHMFHSVGLSVGTVTFFGSHNQFDWPILGTAVRIVMADFLFGLFAACAVFSIYGHLTDAFPVEIIDVASSGMNYAFVTFPECAESLPWSRLWMSAFYVLMAVGALGGAVSYRAVFWSCPTRLMSLASLVARASSLHSAAPGSEWANPVIMFVFGTVIVIVGAFVLHALAENKYDLYAAMEPEPGYGPKDPDQQARYVAFMAERNALSAGRHHLSSSSKASSARPSMVLENTNEENLGAQHTEVTESALTFDEKKSSDVIAKLERVNAASAALTLATTTTGPTATTADTPRATTTATNTAAEPTTVATLGDGKDSSTPNTPDHVDKASK
ncbi:sodium- and chloride-dependent GABA transporter 2-like [Rhipicephalus sanguineus]|uniref:sodium- and chloride-dependent GABA transporter 2-like n=1 Tax=Rhipicephalus sanguineus TaxID=34632 RepID=UPI0020C3CD80|nr:sodium- and chloride-dependent GABA transporter 2-like [Rhipicephalus sanguineus]